MMTSENSLEQVCLDLAAWSNRTRCRRSVKQRQRSVYFQLRPQLSGAERGDSGLCAGASLVRGAIVPAPGLQVKWTENSSGEGCFLILSYLKARQKRF